MLKKYFEFFSLCYPQGTPVPMGSIKKLTYHIYIIKDLYYINKQIFVDSKKFVVSTGDHRRDFIFNGGVSKNAFYN